MYDKKGDNLMSSENLNSFELVLYLYTVQSTVCTVYSVYSVYSVCPLPFSGGPPLQGQDSPRCLPPSRSPSSSLRPCRHSHRTGCTFSCRFCLFVCFCLLLFTCRFPPRWTWRPPLCEAGTGTSGGKVAPGFHLFVCLFVCYCYCLPGNLHTRLRPFSSARRECPRHSTGIKRNIFWNYLHISNHVNQQQKSLNHSQLGKQL